MKPSETRTGRSFVKALVISAAVILFLAGGTALAINFWWQTRGAAVIATLGEGTRFADGHDQQACVTEAVLRVKRSDGLVGFTDEVRNELFLEECLKAAAPTAGFCHNVPSDIDREASASWRGQMSTRYGLEGTLRQGLVIEIQSFCNEDAGAH
jgi:hypothetical protein